VRGGQGADMQRSRKFLLAMFAVAALAGCGGGDEDSTDVGGGEAETTGQATEQTLTFVVEGTKYTSAPSTASAGEATFLLENKDAIEHYVIIDELGLEVEAEGGESANGITTLEPATYIYYCRVPGHRDAGMEGELVVT
jgi:uncharacterized cupredoxin-like copper-binding protein